MSFNRDFNFGFDRPFSRPFDADVAALIAENPLPPAAATITTTVVTQGVSILIFVTHSSEGAPDMYNFKLTYRIGATNPNLSVLNTSNNGQQYEGVTISQQNVVFENLEIVAVKDGLNSEPLIIQGSDF